MINLNYPSPTSMGLGVLALDNGTDENVVPFKQPVANPQQGPGVPKNNMMLRVENAGVLSIANTAEEQAGGFQSE